jgi:hypothetical protein
MAEFKVGVPVESAEPRVLVEGRFGVGLHRFQLVVVNRSGQQSAPDFALVQVLQRPIR